MKLPRLVNLLAILSAPYILVFSAAAQRIAVTSVDELLKTAAGAKRGKVIYLAEDTFKFTQPLDLKSGLTLKGAGIGRTILTHSETWLADPGMLPDPETDHAKFDRTGYLVRCGNDTKDITISHLTLT